MQRVNFQPISKIERGSNDSLLVHSLFFTIQGEGPNVGKPAVFIRLGGCNLQCPGCDTEYTTGSAYERIDSIVTRVGMAFGDYKGERLVVITGGEPMRQDIVPFINLLFGQDWEVQIETNGTLPLADISGLCKRAWQRLQIVVSPKAGKVSANLHPFIVAYKYVLDVNHIDERDGLPESVLGMPAAPARPFPDYEHEVYVQPADEKRDGIGVAQHGSGEGYLVDAKLSDRDANTRNMKATIDSAMKFGYRLCLQTHKIAGLD
jgi:7-carboxy-7-deazaguanine synthase